MRRIFPSTEAIEKLKLDHAIEERCIFIRHGTAVEEQLRGVLSDDLYARVVPSWFNKLIGRKAGAQSDDVMWPGGFFGYPGRRLDSAALGEDVKETWRKEYLPGATSLIATTFCSALAGYLLADHPSQGRLRVTLHRTIVVGTEELLQQCCEYAGQGVLGDRQVAGRTFAVETATIGLAYRTRHIVRSKRGSTSTHSNWRWSNSTSPRPLAGWRRMLRS